MENHSKRCPHCGFVGNYEAASLTICENCGEVLAESWALGDAVTDIMDEGSWIHQFRQAQAQAAERAAKGEEAPWEEPTRLDPELMREMAKMELPTGGDAGVPGLIGPGQVASYEQLFGRTGDAGGAPKLPPFPPPEQGAVILGVGGASQLAGGGLAASAGDVRPLVLTPPGTAIGLGTPLPLVFNVVSSTAPASARPAPEPAAPRVVLGRRASDLAPPPLGVAPEPKLTIHAPPEPRPSAPAEVARDAPPAPPAAAPPAPRDLGAALDLDAELGLLPHPSAEPVALAPASASPLSAELGAASQPSSPVAAQPSSSASASASPASASPASATPANPSPTPARASAAAAKPASFWSRPTTIAAVVALLTFSCAVAIWISR